MSNDISFDYSRKNIAVIGATSGMGLQITRELIGSGAKVLAIGLGDDLMKALIEEADGSLEGYVVDVRDKEALEETINQYVNKHGKLNGSVYTAGISKTTVLRSFSEEDAKLTMDINYWGWIHWMELASKKKYSEDRSSHVVIASAAAHKGESGAFAYSASKAALITCVQTFAKEIAKRGCRVNSVSPGFISTPLTEGYFTNRGFSEKTIEKHLLGLGKSEDVTGAMLFLLSDRASWITGTDIVIDGGYLVSD